MAKALISIDYTVDFVAEEGKLTAGAPAQAISDPTNPYSVKLVDFPLITLKNSAFS